MHWCDVKSHVAFMCHSAYVAALVPASVFVSLFVLVDWRLVSLSCWVWLCFGGALSPMFVVGRCYFEYVCCWHCCSLALRQHHHVLAVVALIVSIVVMMNLCS